MAFRLQLIAAIDDADAGLLLGTDSPQIFSVPGFSLHREMQVMVEAGLSPYRVLSSGTRRVSEYFGTEDTTGTVAVGKRADLLLLNGNPLDDLAGISDRAGVMVNGRWLPEEEIQRRLAEIAEAYSRN
jgi:imidazolonepropionase-like amidohydrolase